MTDEQLPGPDQKDPVTKPAEVNPDPVSDPDAEDAAYRERMKELFEDIEEEETPEQIKAERDDLRKKLIDSAGRVQELQGKQLKLAEQLEEQKREAAQYGQRIKKQAEEQKDFALEKFLKEVLPVIDNLERGLEAISPAQRAADPKFDKLAQGVEKTLSQLTAVFNKFGIKAINPKGEAYDETRHEAISVDDSQDVEPDTVVHVAQKGYELNGRVIRNAKVVVKP